MTNTLPISKSTRLCFWCDKNPEKEEATIILVEVATATAEGMPISISIGVRINPPPMPNMPEKMPVIMPNTRSHGTLAESSAMGK
jgi:hypothetical protein